MPRFQRLTRLIAILLCAWPAASLSTSVTQRPNELVTRFVAAWNMHDPSAFGRLMAIDADWVTASGLRLRGRDRVQEYLAGEHATWAKTTTMKSQSVHVRMLDDQKAIVMFEWQILSPGESGGVPTVARGNNLFVAVLDQGWLIVSGQVARARTR
jgi:uncharacterized protein (TIGR02246 family)